MSSDRRRLANRRRSETFELEVAGLRYKVTVSRFPDDGLAEVFVSNHKAGNASDVAARDAGILVSLCLQHGCDVETIARALCPQHRRKSVRRHRRGAGQDRSSIMTDTILAPGQRIGHFQVLSLDPGGKRAAVACRCGSTHVFSAEALLNGSATCSAVPWSREQIEARRTEVDERRKRREQRDWRPG